MNIGQIPFYLVGQTFNVALSIGHAVARSKGRENAADNVQVISKMAENILAGISAARIAHLVVPNIGSKAAVGAGFAVGLALCGLSYYATEDFNQPNRGVIGLSTSLFAKALNTAGVVQAVAAQGFNSIQSKAVATVFTVLSALNLHGFYNNNDPDTSPASVS